MLDINLIREKPEKVKRALLKRMDKVDFSNLLKWDEKRRSTIKEANMLKKKRNEVSEQIAHFKREGAEEDAQECIAEMKEVASNIKKLDEDIKILEDKIQLFLERLPNIPEDDVPPGGKENNIEIKKWGEKPTFGFSPKNHVELLKDLDMIDFERGTKLGGNGFWIYKGAGALLEWALLNYFVEEHLKNKYKFILPPHILTYQCGYTAGQFPKFTEDDFFIKNQENKGYQQFLLPTAETALVNLHRDEILLEDELPLKYFAYSPCYRREAGSYRANERGTIRGHQFNKVEMFCLTRPDSSNKILNELVEKAENLVQGLGLHYRVSKLAAKDCSSAMAKTYDIEVWIPSMGEYKEVSSASNAHDYQARRGNIKYRRNKNKQTEFVHTLNASGLATSRLLPAIVEQFQQADGRVKIPTVLQKWVGKDYLG